MGILDDAIREHLDLKRRHGARDAELREIEDEALGSGEDQPDPFAANELFNEVSAGTAEAEPSASTPEGIADLGEIGEPPVGGEEPTRLVEPEPEALQPPTPAPEPGEALSEPLSPPEGIEQVPGQTELPGQDEIPGQERLEDPLQGYQPPAETAEPSADLPAPPGPPSESLEDLIAEEEPFPEDAAASPPELHGTDEEELPLDPEAPAPPAEPEEKPEAAEEAPEPRSSVPEPPPPPPDTGSEPPGRARGRVDVPTQEHPPPGQTGGLPPLPEQEPEPLDEPLADEPFDDEPAAESDGPALYDFETDEDPIPPGPTETDDDFEALGPAEEEAPYLEEEEPYAEEPASGTEPAPFEEPGTAVRPSLEDEEASEGGAPDPEEGYEEEGEEGLWFEKGPPQDFDFEDD
jgi:nicotinate-nucleotide--dimethylbenzimidazole phosphoribosyltransferase